MYVCTHAHVHVCTYARMHVCTCVDVRVRVCVRVRVRVCVCMHAGHEGGRQTATFAGCLRAGGCGQEPAGRQLLRVEDVVNSALKLWRLVGEWRLAPHCLLGMYAGMYAGVHAGMYGGSPPIVC